MFGIRKRLGDRALKVLNIPRRAINIIVEGGLETLQARNSSPSPLLSGLLMEDVTSLYNKPLTFSCHTALYETVWGGGDIELQFASDSISRGRRLSSFSFLSGK